MNDLQAALKELKDGIAAQEGLVIDNMKGFYNGRARFIVFLSFCDMKSRAYVCRGIGNTVDTSWKSAVDLMNRRIKDLKLSPVWFKADIVKEIREYSCKDFIKYISGIKTNYFREGISFDSMFNNAFLEQEVNANVFIDQEKDSTLKHLVWNNINFYMRSNLGSKYQLSEESVQKVFTFDTIGFFHDGNSLFRLEGEWLDNGRRHIDAVDGDLLYSIVEKASGFLSKQLDSTGKFRYGYFPCFDKEVPGYNMLRHASTSYSMLEAFETTGDPSLGQAVCLALEYLVNEGIEILRGIDGTARAFVVERTGGNEIKLGANAAAILAMSKYTKIFNDNKYLQVMQELAEGIDYFHNKHDGSFVHVLNFPDLSVKEKFRVIYYDGEAAFALMRLFEIDKNERWLKTVEQAFEYFINNKYWDNHDHWLSYCSNELQKYKPDRRYIDFNLRNAGGILDFCLTRETTYPTLLELLMATYDMIERLKKDGQYPEVLEGFDEEKFLKAVDHRAEHQLNGLYFPEVAMYFKSPESILWAFYIRHHSFRSRIDDNEHNISGYCSYLRQRLGHTRF